MKRLIYEILRNYVRLGLKLYFRKIEVSNLENVPNDKPVLFTANHQNAFLDALLIVAFNNRYTYFLARASIFSNPVVTWLLELINLMPIYRIRDGKHSLANNQAIFEQCNLIFKSRHTILIFPEGNHDMRRKLRPLSKGFTRIAFGALKQVDELYIIPVGLNYQHHQKFRSDVSIIFGRAVAVNEYDANQPLELKKAVSEQLKSLITHIEDEDYESVIQKLNEANFNYLNPASANKILKGEEPITKPKDKTSFMYSLFHGLSVINNLLVIVFWKLIRTSIKDPVFIGSLKFSYGIFAVPFIYFLQALVIYKFWGLWAGIVYFIISLFIARFLPDRKNFSNWWGSSPSI